MNSGEFLSFKLTLSPAGTPVFVTWIRHKFFPCLSRQLDEQMSRSEMTDWGQQLRLSSRPRRSLSRVSAYKELRFVQAVVHNHRQHQVVESVVQNSRQQRSQVWKAALQSRRRITCSFVDAVVRSTCQPRAHVRGPEFPEPSPTWDLGRCSKQPPVETWSLRQFKHSTVVSQTFILLCK